MVIANKAGKGTVFVVVYDEDFMDFLCNALTFYNLDVSGTLYRMDWLKDADARQFDTLLLDVSLEKDGGKQQVMAIKANPRYINVRVVVLSSCMICNDSIRELGADAALKIPFELPDLISKLGGNIEEPVAG